MNWDAIATISATISALAVVVSLIYLTLQIRQGNVQAKGAAHADWLTTWNDTIKGWIRDRETVQILQRGFADFSVLSNVDKAIFAQQLAVLINHWHLAADLADGGLLDESVYRGATEVVLSVCATAGGFQYLESNASGFPRGPQLLRMAKSGEGNLPPFDVLAPWWSIGEAGSNETAAR